MPSRSKQSWQLTKCAKVLATSSFSLTEALQVQYCFAGTLTAVQESSENPVLLVFVGMGAEGGDAESLSLTGRQISADRECTRDADSRVLQLTISEHESSVTLLATATGGDVAKIRAPLEMHGTESMDFRGVLSGCTSSGYFQFDCEVLYVSSPAEAGKNMWRSREHVARLIILLQDGERADQLLRALKQEAYCGKDPVVNSGVFAWRLPPHGVSQSALPFDSDFDE